MAKRKKDSSTLLENRRARYLYFLSDFMTAGMVLKGTEIKSLRNRDASLSDAYVHIKNGEAWISNMHIAPYRDGSIFNVDHLRDRKLLLNKSEIRKLDSRLKGEGAVTCVPIRVFLSHGYAKIEIAIGVGKKYADKREVIKKRDAKKKIAKAIREGAKASDE